MYEYECIVKRIVDGDTVDVDIDLGFDTWIFNRRIRLIGIDAPETRTKDLDEKALGLRVKDIVEAMLPVGSKQVLLSKDYDKYGRILGDFKLHTGVLTTTLTEELLRQQLVEVYQC